MIGIADRAIAIGQMLPGRAGIGTGIKPHARRHQEAIGIRVELHDAMDVAIPAIARAVIAVELAPGRAGIIAAKKTALLDRDVKYRRVPAIDGDAFGVRAVMRVGKGPFVGPRHACERGQLMPATAEIVAAEERYRLRPEIKRRRVAGVSAREREDVLDRKSVAALLPARAAIGAQIETAIMAAGRDPSPIGCGHDRADVLAVERAIDNVPRRGWRGALEDIDAMSRAHIKPAWRSVAAIDRRAVGGKACHHLSSPQKTHLHRKAIVRRASRHQPRFMAKGYARSGHR